MKRHLLKSMSLFLLAAVASWIAAAQQSATAPASAAVASTVPKLINYSGILKDTAGKPLGGVLGVTFLFYRDPQGGVPLWMETQNVTPDRSGRFTVTLGATTSQGLPADVFANGEARWLALQVVGEAEQPRVLLVAVPYALKAGDAETIGGLPPSAFVLAAPTGSGSTAAASASGNSAPAAPSGAPPVASNVTTTGGTVSALPLWTTATNVQSSVMTQTGSGATAKIGINTTTPGATLDVKGTANIQGVLTAPATGTATSSAGNPSQAHNFVGSSFNSGTAAAVNQTFQWKAEPSGNNTSTPSGTLNLLFGSGSSSPTETGLKISNKGLFTFAAGQTFPGTGSGTVTSVGLTAPSSDFTVTGSPVTNSGTLNVAWNIAPTSSNIANTIVKRDGTGSFNAGAITANLGMTGLSSGGAAAVTGTNSSGGFGVYGTSGGSDGVHGVTSSASFSGVAGVNTKGGIGVYGTDTTGSLSGTGVYGTGGTGVFGAASNSFGIGVYGTGGTGSSSTGVYGTGGTGVFGITTTSGVGVYGSTTGGGLAGYFNGNVQLTGQITSYNGTATAANGVPSIVLQYAFFSNGGGNNVFTNLFTPTNDAILRVTAFQECTATSGGGTFFSLGFLWTIPTGGTKLNAIGGPDCASLNGSGGSIVAHVKGGTAIQYNYAGMNAPFQTTILVEQLL